MKGGGGFRGHATTENCDNLDFKNNKEFTLHFQPFQLLIEGVATPSTPNLDPPLYNQTSSKWTALQVCS